VGHGTRFFWALIVLLLGASTYFGVGAESRRRAVQRNVALLETGDIVSFLRVLDGDTVVVENERHETASVRIVGIKALDATNDKDPSSRFGRAAMDELTRVMSDEPIRVMLHETGRDRHGRTLAQLFVADEDMGLRLVSQGLALVYTVYPFAATTVYLHEQEAARGERRGLWADEEAAKRAGLLATEWRRQAR
jgi:micrococcal nuclease